MEALHQLERDLTEFRDGCDHQIGMGKQKEKLGGRLGVLEGLGTGREFQ